MIYQYKTVKVKTGGLRGGDVDIEELDEILNTLGSEGWELVNAFNTSMANGASKSIVAIFRRSA